MGFRSVLSKPFAAYINGQTKKWSANPGIYQQKIFKEIVSKASNTAFGKDHGFGDIKSHDDSKSLRGMTSRHSNRFIFLSQTFK